MMLHQKNISGAKKLFFFPERRAIQIFSFIQKSFIVLQLVLLIQQNKANS